MRAAPGDFRLYQGIETRTSSGRVSEQAQPDPGQRDPHLRVLLSPGLPDSIARTAVERAHQAYARIQSILQAPRADRPFTLVLYANPGEYDRLARLDPDLLPATRSRYDSRFRTLHLPATAADTDWRHEWTHAILSDRSPGSPYWLHEGLAVLLEETDGLAMGPRLPRPIVAVRERVVRHVETGGGLEKLLGDSSPGPLAGPTAGWFCAYLHARGILAPLLHEARRPAPSPDNRETSNATAPRDGVRGAPIAWPRRFKTLSPDTPRGLRTLRSDFLRWLRRGGDQRISFMRCICSFSSSLRRNWST
ncbi:MAG: hypothetical protein RIF32_18520 [Leptospirales bacterium]|jgi:hypothetical protein